MMLSVDVENEYRRHVGALSHYAAVLVGPDDAMDVVNDAVAATLRRGSLDSVADVRAYWFRAVTFTASSWHRSRTRRRAREQRALIAEGSPSRSEPDVAEALRVLSVLTVQQRAVVYLTYWADWDTERIAVALGVSTGTVRKQLGRARQRLREVLNNE